MAQAASAPLLFEIANILVAGTVPVGVSAIWSP
jgi:hypothetical protein